MQKFWKIAPVNNILAHKFAQRLGVSPIVGQLMINRGVNHMEDARQFLMAELSELNDPFGLKDMAVAVKRIQEASTRREKVVVFGDYDVDGVTSSAILSNLLKRKGIEVFHYIPHRMEEGYGLNVDVIDYASQHEASLLIAVDCGITAIEEVRLIQENGIDVIILDHHEPSEEGLPPALAVIDPKRADCTYPFKHLAAVGVAAKLWSALEGAMDDQILGLTALGTIADVVPMIGENRIFVKKGLERLDQIPNKGLLALIDVAKIKNKKLNHFHVGFVLGPRINAAGRMDSAHESLSLLLTQDEQEAYALASKLDKLNSQRKKMQNDIIKEALDLVEQEVNFQDQKVIVLSKEGWHKGLLGIVASRISDKYYRPTIIISLEDGLGTASARSIEGFHLHDALTVCNQYLDRFGGHKGAAGLTIKEENIDCFRDMINEIAGDRIHLKELVPTISIDCHLPLSELTLELTKSISDLGPYGEGNPEPVFFTKNLQVKGKARLLGKDTIKFWVTDGQRSISAIGFGMAHYHALVAAADHIDLAYHLTIDDWNKEPTVQLKIKDIKVSAGIMEGTKKERLMSRPSIDS
jgi:single-stranded-DNA-specific exonuclease